MARRSYAVAWREGAGPQNVGKLVLEEARLRLEGRSAAEETRRTLPYDRIGAVSFARPDGHRILILAVDARDSIEIDSLDRPGILGELHYELRLRSGEERR